MPGVGGHEVQHAEVETTAALSRWPNRKLVVDFAAQNHLPAIYQQSVFAEVGGLMA
jgi:hypothetical protein